MRAGRAGGFGWVVGVDRIGQADALTAHGADVVVERPRRARRTARHERDDAFAVDPGRSASARCDLDKLAQTESVFALSNGHIGLRGNLDEGEPHGRRDLPQRLLRARPLPYAEAGYGYPEAGQTLVNVTNGKVMRLLVDDEPFDVRYGELVHHERTLDLREGTLRREVVWRSPAGGAVRVRSTRLVSFVQRAVAAICFEVEAVDAAGPHRRAVRARRQRARPDPERRPPRRGGAAAPLVGERPRSPRARGRAAAPHPPSGLRMAAAMDHVVDGPDGTVTAAETEDDLARVTVTTELQPGETLRIVKFLAYGWSSQRSAPSLRDQADAAIASARREGWDGLKGAQRAYLDDLWARADVVLDGDAALQQAVRFAIFHTLQAAARAEQRAIPAKGLTGAATTGTASGTWTRSWLPC